MNDIKINDIHNYVCIKKQRKNNLQHTIFYQGLNSDNLKDYNLENLSYLFYKRLILYYIYIINFL